MPPTQPDERSTFAAVARRAAGQRPQDALPGLTLQELFERLGWFVSIRWFAGLGALLLVAVGWYVFGVHIPPGPIVLTIAALFAYNTVFRVLVRRAYRHGRVSLRFVHGCANAQIICDMVALTFVMHFSGGVENPFIVFFICPLVIASELLPTRVAYLHALLGALLIHLVAWLEYSGALPHVPVGHMLGNETCRNALVVAQFSATLSLLGFAIVFLGGSIAGRLRQREAELEAAHAHLRALEESKSFLMRRTSHDLRAPLDALVSMMRAVATRAAATIPPDLADALARAERRAVDLTHLIDELHRYAVLRDSTAVLRTEPIDLADVVRQSVGLYEAMATERGLRVAATIAAPAVVPGNGDALCELVSNLLSNAIQYTPAGGTLTVTLRTTATDVELTVADTGIGIPPAALPHVFDEFFRAPNAKEVFRSGTGMGLPIVKRVVETYGGTLTVHSATDRGTTFVVTFPRA
jgi:signal transduction histidine kinase